MITMISTIVIIIGGSARLWFGGQVSNLPRGRYIGENLAKL
jgi:hypothetical protein